MGLRIGKGETLKQIIGDMTAVAEGVLTARSAHMLAKKLAVQVNVNDSCSRKLETRSYSSQYLP